MKTEVNKDLNVTYDCQLKFLNYVDHYFFHCFSENILKELLCSKLQ